LAAELNRAHRDAEPSLAQTVSSGPANVITTPRINTRHGIFFGVDIFFDLGIGFVLPAAAHSGALYQW
jgi:hypothetical protein